jgi:multidrug efflux pump
MFGALIFSFLKMPGANAAFFTNGWTTTLNIYSQVGLVTLVGLVSKNGILIVQFANELQRTGLPKLQAVREAALIRLRPVLMTSAATICGHFPLTLVSGAGAAARNSIGITIVAGHGARHPVHPAGDSFDLRVDRQTACRRRSVEAVAK